MLSSLESGSAPVDVAVGSAWGLVTQEAQDVFLPKLAKYEILAEVIKRVEERMRSGEWRDDYMERVDTSKFADATHIGCSKAPSGAPCAAIEFEAFIDHGRARTHKLLVATPSERPTWTGILAEDHTDNDRPFVFSTSFVRDKKCRMKVLVDSSKAWGYIFFLCYLALRAKRLDRMTMMHMHAELSKNPNNRPTFHAYKEKAEEHIRSATNLAGHESLVRALRNGRRVREKAVASDKPVNEKRIVAINTTLTNLEVHQKAFCGIVNKEFHQQRMREAAQARSVASKYAVMSDADAVFRIVSDVNCRAIASAAKRKERSTQVYEEVAKRAKQLRAEGKLEEAFNILTNVQATDLPAAAQSILAGK